jgi:hypothetical protein
MVNICELMQESLPLLSESWLKRSTQNGMEFGINNSTCVNEDGQIIPGL